MSLSFSHEVFPSGWKGKGDVRLGSAARRPKQVAETERVELFFEDDFLVGDFLVCGQRKKPMDSKREGANRGESRKECAGRVEVRKPEI